MDLIARLRTDEEMEYFLSFAERFTYVDSHRIPIVMDQMAEIIAKDTGFSPSDTQIVATAYDSQPDSSQMILQQLKSRLQRHNWASAKLVNQVGRCISQVKSHPNIILIDEFAGTGNTIIGRVKYIKKNAEQFISSGGKLNIHVVIAFAMNKAIQNIVDASIHVTPANSLAAAISEQAPQDRIDDEIVLMKRLESYLNQNVPGYKRPFPSFGYGGAEALYTMEHNNVPNSVFPIMWWRFANDGSEIDPILWRFDENFS